MCAVGVCGVCYIYNMWCMYGALECDFAHRPTTHGSVSVSAYAYICRHKLSLVVGGADVDTRIYTL